MRARDKGGMGLSNGGSDGDDEDGSPAGGARRVVKRRGTIYGIPYIKKIGRQS